MGQIFLYFGGPSGLATSPAATISGPSGATQFGSVMSSAGDVNCDGYADVVFGAPHETPAGAQQFSGEAYVYFGGPNGLPATPSWTFVGYEDEGQFGGSVAAAGDVNGDGCGDLIVGGRAMVGGVAQAVTIFLGSRSGLSESSSLGLPGAVNVDAVAGAGDVNGDGYADVIVGDEVAGGSATTSPGNALIYLGGPKGLANPSGPAPASATLSGADSNGSFGASVASAGDVTGEGYSDVVVWAWGNSFTGAVYVFYGGPDGIPTAESTQASATLLGPANVSYYGNSLASAGRLDNSGDSTLVVGCSACDGGSGQVFLFRGNGVFGPGSAATTLTGSTANGAFGQGVY